MENLTIVKVGGAVVEDPTTLNTLLDDFAARPGNKLLVHGGGRAADKLLNRLGVEIKKVDGRRITDKETIDVVTMVYAGLAGTGPDAAGRNACRSGSIPVRHRE